MKAKTAFDGEWVKTSMLSRRFKVIGHCEICGRMTAGTVWHSIRTGKTRCRHCFTPEVLR